MPTIRIGELKLARTVAIDLGTSRTRLADANGSLLAEIETVAAVDSSTSKVAAVGENAIKLAAERPGRFILASPIGRSKVKNIGLLNSYLSVLAKSTDLKSFSRSKVALAMAADSKTMDVKAVQACMSDLGVKELVLVETTLAGAIGAGLDPVSPEGVMIANLSASRAEAGILALGESVSWAVCDRGGADCNGNIYRFLEEHHGVIVSRDVTEELKIGLLKQGRRAPRIQVSVWGRSAKTGDPSQVVVMGSDLLDLIDPVLRDMVGACTAALARCPAELVSDLYESGITLIGGVSLTEGLVQVVEASTGLKVRLSGTPQAAVVQGLCSVLSDGRRSAVHQMAGIRV